MMIDDLAQAGRLLSQTQALVGRAADYGFPSTPALVTRRALLDQARHCLDDAKRLLDIKN